MIVAIVSRKVLLGGDDDIPDLQTAVKKLDINEEWLANIFEGIALADSEIRSSRAAPSGAFGSKLSVPLQIPFHLAPAYKFCSAETCN